MTKGILVLVLLGVLVNMALRALRGPARKPAAPRVETASKCPRCGAYRMAGESCGTPGCGTS